MGKILKKFNITREEFLGSMIGASIVGVGYLIFYIGLGVPIIVQAMNTGFTMLAFL